jgi:hypothetical protein
MDIFKRLMWYVYEDRKSGGIVELSLDRVKEIIALNKEGNEPDTIEKINIVEEKIDYENVVGQDSINRFDSKRKFKKGNRKNKKRRPKKA